MVKVYHAIGFLLVLVLAGVSCEDKKREETSNRGKKIFRYNQAEGLSSLDPAFARNQATIWATHQLYNGLFELNAEAQAVPSLVASWTISPDGRTYTFELRKGIRFHDSPVFASGKGREVVAHDFVYSFRRLLDPTTGSTGSWVFADKVARDARGRVAADCFEALDHHTLKIRLQAPFRPFLQLLATPYTYVVPREAVEQYGKQFRNHPVGTGPFMFKSWEEGNQLLLVKNDHYWRRDERNQPLPYLDGVQVSFIPDKDRAFRHFAQGKLSFLAGIDEKARQEFLNQNGTIKEEFSGKFRVQKAPYLNIEYLGIQFDSALYADKHHPLLDKRVRQALNYAIDRHQVIALLENNWGVPVTTGFVSQVKTVSSPEAFPEGLTATEPDTTRITPGYEYNPAKARQLLADAGYPQGQGLPTLTLYINPTQEKRCEFLQKQWAAVGINVELEVNRYAAHQELIDQGQSHFFRGAWVGEYPDVENYLEMFYSKSISSTGLNKTHFQHAAFDHLYEKAHAEQDSTQRYRLYQAMEQIVQEEAPIIVLYYDEAVRLSQPNVEGLHPNALNTLNLERVNIQPDVMADLTE